MRKISIILSLLISTITISQNTFAADLGQNIQAIFTGAQETKSARFCACGNLDLAGRINGVVEIIEAIKIQHDEFTRTHGEGQIFEISLISVGSGSSFTEKVIVDQILQNNKNIFVELILVDPLYGQEKCDAGGMVHGSQAENLNDSTEVKTDLTNSYSKQIEVKMLEKVYDINYNQLKNAQFLFSFDGGYDAIKAYAMATWGLRNVRIDRKKAGGKVVIPTCFAKAVGKIQPLELNLRSIK